MRYRLLGPSGLRVSELCLGTMTFGEAWGWGADRKESRRQLDLFADRGGNFIDTSVNYTDGESETLIGEFLDGRRDRFVVATKYSLTRSHSDDPNSGGNSRKSMRRAVERSLERLRTDYIDVLYLHMWDYLTPVEEVVRGMDDLVRAGKVIYVAFSDTPDWIVAEANTMASIRGSSPFVALQVPYSIADRAVERSLIPMARHWDMTVMAWGLLEGGILTGKYAHLDGAPTREDPADVKLGARIQGILEEIRSIAVEGGRSMAQVAINWVRQRGPYVIPILGARSASQLEENLDVLDWELTPEQLRRLDEVSQIDMGFPHDFLEGNRNIFGATFDLIEQRR